MEIHSMTSLRNAALAGLACLAATACSPKQGEFGDQLFPHAKWAQVPPAPDNLVEVVTFGHVVSFSEGQAGLDPAARDDLAGFIRLNRIGTSDRIVVQPPEGTADHLTGARVTSVTTEFARLGLVALESTDPGASAIGADPGSGEVAVLVTRAVVVPPDCTQPQPDPTLRPEQPWGCFVNTSLGLMVANPMDLVEGRDLGPADGEQASAALRRYRQDEIKALQIEETSQ